MELADSFVIRRSGCAEAIWGNVFLTSSWTLYIDWHQEQHDCAMERLLIDRGSVLISGSMSRSCTSFRSSPGYDRGEIDLDLMFKLEREIRRILKGDIHDRYSAGRSGC